MLVLFQLMVEGNPLPEAWRRVHYYVFGCAKSKMLIWDCDGILPTMAQLPTHLGYNTQSITHLAQHPIHNAPGPFQLPFDLLHQLDTPFTYQRPTTHTIGLIPRIGLLCMTLPCHVSTPPISALSLQRNQGVVEKRGAWVRTWLAGTRLDNSVNILVLSYK